MKMSAIISACGLFRYWLTRVWDEAKPLLPIIMLNPSTADADLDDPTIRRCIGFAREWGYGGIIVVNLYAFRATDPADLKAKGWQVGPDNDRHILEAVTTEINGAVLYAWGANAQTERARHVVDLVSAWAVPIQLGLTNGGHPKHPLYLPADTPLKLYEPTWQDVPATARTPGSAFRGGRPCRP